MLGIYDEINNIRNNKVKITYTLVLAAPFDSENYIFT